ncbi:hypothetical protein HKX48_006049 [Thoreauomyces humboldtii]|nr:hypothetical protein HKX48_006049 [Thoreauomyces humboldtii]
MSWAPPKSSASSAKSKISDLDVGFDDADLDDLLLSSSDDDADVKKKQPEERLDAESFDGASPPKSAASSPELPKARAAVPVASRPTPLAMTHAAPVAPVKKPGTGKNVDDILRGLDDDFDDPPRGTVKVPVTTQSPERGPSFGAAKASAESSAPAAPQTSLFDSPTTRGVVKGAAAAKGKAATSAGTSVPTAKPLLPWEKAQHPAPTFGVAAIERPAAVPKLVPSSTGPLPGKPVLPWEKNSTAGAATPASGSLGASQSPIRTLPATQNVPVSTAASPVTPRARPSAQSKRPTSVDMHDDDNILDLLGSDDSPISSRPRSGRSSMFSANIPVDSSSRPITPRPVTPGPFNTANPLLAGKSSPAKESPAPITPAADDFVPSFLLEASGPRRAGRPRQESATVPAPVGSQNTPATRAFNLPFLSLTPKPAAQVPIKVATAFPAVPLEEPQAATRDSTTSKPVTLSALQEVQAKNGLKPAVQTSQQSSIGKSQTSEVSFKPAAAGRRKGGTKTLARVPSALSLSSLVSLNPDDDNDEDDEGGSPQEDEDDSGTPADAIGDDETGVTEDESDVQDFDLDGSDLVISSDPPSTAEKVSKKAKAASKPATTRGALTKKPEDSKRIQELQEENARLAKALQDGVAFAERAKEDQVRELKEAHAKEIEILRQAQETGAKSVLEEHQSALAALTTSHVQELKSVETIVGTLKTELATRTSELREANQKLDDRLEEHNKDREAAFQVRETQVSEMHAALVFQRKEMETERIKIQELLSNLQTSIRDTHEDSDADRRGFVEERQRYARQLQDLETERQDWLRNHQADRTALMKEREDFAGERKRILNQLNEERVNVMMEKSGIEARRHAVEQAERDMEMMVSRAAAQVKAEEEQHVQMRLALQASQTAVHQQMAKLRAETLTLDAQKAKLGVEKAAFEAERSASENIVRDLMGVGAEASKINFI